MRSLSSIMAVSSWTSFVLAILIAFSAEKLYSHLTRKPFTPAKKHCFITGGSTGLGKALAIALVKRGAHVTIVARRQSELDKAATEIKVKHMNEKSSRSMLKSCIVELCE